jgi:hypothetical protein
MNKFEISAYKRKIQRERGEYKPEIPPFTKIERSEKAVALRLQERLSTIGGNAGAPELRKIGTFIDGTMGQLKVHPDGTLMSKGHQSGPGDGEDLLAMSPDLRSRESLRNQSPADRFHQKMCEHTESSRRDKGHRYRNCCRQQSLALKSQQSKKSLTINGDLRASVRNKTNLAKTIAFKQGVGGASRDSAGLLSDGKNTSTFFSNRNVMINLQTSSPIGREQDFQEMPDIPEDERGDLNDSMNHKQLFKKSVKISREDIQKEETPDAYQERRAKFRRDRQGSRAPASNPIVMKQFAYKIGGKVSSQFDTNVRRDVAKDILQFDKYEKENKDKIMNNVDEAMEERALQDAVFKRAQEAAASMGRGSKKERKGGATAVRVKTARHTLGDKCGPVETRQEAVARMRSEKRAAAQAEREVLRNQRNNKVKMTMYGVLGLDSILPKDMESSIIQDKKSSGNEHSYGLDHKLFMSAPVREKAEEEYKKMMSAIDGKIAYGRKQGKFLRDLELGTQKSTSVGGKKKQSSAALAYGEPKPGSIKWIVEHPEELEAYIQQMKDDKNQLKLRVERLGERQGVFGGWLDDFNQLCAIKIKTDGKLTEEEKNEGQQRKDENDKKKDHDAQEKEEKKKAHLVKIRDDMIKEKRQRMEQYQFNIQDIIDDRGKRKAKESKPTYPMCMEYYEPFNIAIFALVSREIQIHQLKQTGVRRTFFHIQSMRVESMIV